MASLARFMMARDLNGTAVTPLYQTASNSSEGNAATLQLINSLVFAESKSVRTSTIILAVFNILASAATAMSILYDCYWASKRSNPKFKASKFCVSAIHPAETFPLILAVGTVIQGIVFAVSQSQGLTGLFAKGCSTIAQFMWPAIMIVPYLQLVFGIECSIRSLQSTPFKARGKYDVTICCAAVILMLFGTWIPSHIFPQPDICYACLLWFVSRYSEAGLIILSIVGGVLLISAFTIFTRLSTVTTINEHQRIAASRMVYYLVLGILSLAFVIPYFACVVINHGESGSVGLKATMIATVVLNLSGLMSGLLHLFLRSNTATTAFGPKNGTHWKTQKHQIRIWGPNELAFGTHMDDLVSGPRTPVRDSESRAESQAILVGPEKGDAISMRLLDNPPYSPWPKFNPLASNPNSVEQKATMPTVPEPTTKPSSAIRGRTRAPSYSLFPTEKTSPTKGAPQSIRSAESVYDISDLAPPPAIFGPGGSRHRRDSSIASSATVQIGLRLSHAPTSPMEDILTMPLPQTTYGALPSTTFNVNSSLPLSTFNANTPAPLRLQTQSLTKPEPPMRSPRRPSPLNTNIISPTQTSPLMASINKLLPPTPKVLTSVVRESKTQLSPAVYSPEKKFRTPSPAMKTPQSALNPVNSSRNNPLGNGSPTRLPRSDSSQELARTEAKNDWI